MNISKQAIAAEIAKMDRIIAIRDHVLGNTSTCPACEEGRSH